MYSTSFFPFWDWIALFSFSFLEIFLSHVSLTLSSNPYPTMTESKRKAILLPRLAEKAFPLISKTSNRALPLPENPSLPQASFKDRPLRNDPTRHADPCSDVPALVREAGGAGLDLPEPRQLSSANLSLCVYTWLCVVCLHFCVRTWVCKSVNHDFLLMTCWCIQGQVTCTDITLRATQMETVFFLVRVHASIRVSGSC